MTTRAILTLAGLLSLLMPTSSWGLAYTGSLTIANHRIPGISAAASGSVGNVAGPLTFTLPASGVAAFGVTLPITDPALNPILGLQLSAANAAGAFSGGAGTAAIHGVEYLCLFGTCAGPPPANIAVPLSPVGVGGTTFLEGLVNITVIGASWTTGTVSIGTLTQMGSVTGGGAVAGGSIHYVTPVFVSTSVGGSAVLPTFATLTLNFVPEPSTLTLLGLGVAVLTALGRRRLR